MPDQYVDTTYTDAFVGTAFRTALFAETGTDFDTVAEAATAVVQSDMRNSGYTPLATSTPGDVEELVKLAVIGVMWEMMCQRPGASVALPADWDSSEFKLSRERILTGAAQLAATADTSAAVGGAKFTSRTDSPQTFSRTQLEGY